MLFCHVLGEWPAQLTGTTTAGTQGQLQPCRDCQSQQSGSRPDAMAEQDLQKKPMQVLLQRPMGLPLHPCFRQTW